jgi:PST family polysaccharide transporter
VNYWSRNADNLLVGRFLGLAPLGLYGLAYQLILMPLQQVTSIIGEVMVPVMARGRCDPAQVRLAFTRAVQAVALVLFPIMIGIVIVADEAIPVLFGDQWRAAAPVARVLAVGGCFQALGATVGWIYQSQGRSDVMFRWGLFATVVTVAGIVAGLPWGVVGVATGYTAAVVVLTPLSHYVAGRLIGMRMPELLVGVKPALVATIVMAMTASLVRTVLIRSGQGDVAVVIGAAIAGIGVYVLALAVLRPVSFDVLGSIFTRPKSSR